MRHCNRQSPGGHTCATLPTVLDLPATFSSVTTRSTRKCPRWSKKIQRFLSAACRWRPLSFLASQHSPVFTSLQAYTDLCLCKPRIQPALCSSLFPQNWFHILLFTTRKSTFFHFCCHFPKAGSPHPTLPTVQPCSVLIHISLASSGLPLEQAAVLSSTNIEPCSRQTLRPCR